MNQTVGPQLIDRDAAVLSQFCRKFKVGRWPYRKLSSIDKLIETVLADVQENPEYMSVGPHDDLLHLPVVTVVTHTAV
jgi:hypothetical protein